MLSHHRALTGFVHVGYCGCRFYTQRTKLFKCIVQVTQQFNANLILFFFLLQVLSHFLWLACETRGVGRRRERRKMSVISSRDPAMSTTSATLTRPGSRSSELRPIFLLERCLAIRFERITQSTTQTTTTTTTSTTTSKKSESRPGSSLSQLSNWFNFHQPSKQQQQQSNTPPESCASSDRTIRQQQPSKEQQTTTTSLVKDSSAPAGWVYDGGFVLYQVKFFSNSFFGGF